MATVRIDFDGGDVAILVGAQPAAPDQPIASPTDTGYLTNTPFILAPGVYCFTLRSPKGHTPLWQSCQTVDGTQTALGFKALP
jgi:hypothetical protein